jgi:hypothetical protein
VVSAGVDRPFGHAVYAAASDTAASDTAEGQIPTATPEAHDGTGVWVVDVGKP